MKLMQKRMLVFLCLVGAIFLLKFSGIMDYINLDYIRANRLRFLNHVKDYPLSSALIYMVVYTGAVALLFPSASLLTLLGGFLFGALYGTLYTVIAATLGATLAFVLVRYVFGNQLQKHYAVQLARFNRMLERDGISYLLFMRLVAVIPFFIANICAGLTNIPLVSFVWTTFVGIIPGSLIYSFAGEQLQSIASVRDIFTWKMLFVFILLGCMALIPVLIRQFRNKKGTKNI